MTRPLTKNAAVLRSPILPVDDLGQPPDPADPPLTEADLHRINIYVFETLCDPWTAAQKCGISPAHLVLYLDQPHIARFVRKARQAIHIHNFEAAAIHTRSFLQASTSEPARLRAAATLIRAYTRSAPRATAERTETRADNGDDTRNDSRKAAHNSAQPTNPRPDRAPTDARTQTPSSAPAASPTAAPTAASTSNTRRAPSPQQPHAATRGP